MKIDRYSDFASIQGADIHEDIERVVIDGATFLKEHEHKTITSLEAEVERWKSMALQGVKGHEFDGNSPCYLKMVDGRGPFLVDSTGKVIGAQVSSAQNRDETSKISISPDAIVIMDDEGVGVDAEICVDSSVISTFYAIQTAVGLERSRWKLVVKELKSVIAEIKS